MSNLVGDRFQITIDKSLRDRLGIRPGDLAVERVEDGKLVIEFVPRAHRESLLGIAKRYATRPLEPITDWEAYFTEVWAARVQEIEGGPEADSRQSGRPTASST